MMNKWKILGTLGIVILLFVFGLSAAYFEAQLLIHNPVSQRDVLTHTPADYGMKYENVELTTDDGYHLAAWYVPSENRAAIILVHGYKGARANVLPIAQILARHGYGLLLLDLRAHGESQGEVISFGFNETRDVNAAYLYLSNRPEVDPERVGAVGVSMGGSIVLLSAAQNTNIKAVVSESAYASLENEVPIQIEGNGIPFFLAPLVQRFVEQSVGFKAEQASAVNYIAKISPRPVFILQGGMDSVVPPESGQQLYDAAKEPRELWFEPDLWHAEFPTKLPEEYEKRVVAFFDQYLLGK